MSKDKNYKPYTPDLRTGYSPSKHDLISKGKIKKPDTLLPNTVTDDIAVNNISYSEFDYTEQPELDIDK